MQSNNDIVPLKIRIDVERLFHSCRLTVVEQDQAF